MELNSSRLFLHYAFACAEDKLRAKRISNQSFALLEMFVKTKRTPTTSFLAHCFPNAVKKLREFAQKENSTDMWSLKAVAKYWHQHQGSGGDCAVKIVTILSVNTDGTAIVICENRTFNAVNFYNLDLQVDDEVYLHNRFIIEKVKY